MALRRQAPTHHGLNEQLKLVESENNRALEQQQNATAGALCATISAPCDSWTRRRPRSASCCRL